MAPLNIIHYMHDKYAYESIEMALHDKEVYRTLGCGMSGLSIAADSLAAVKYAKVYPIYNKDAKTLEGHEYEYVEGADDDPDRRLPHRGRVPGLRQRRRPRRRHRQVGRLHGHGPGQEAPGLPRRRPDPVHPDDHLQRRVRQEHRFLPVRPAKWAPCTLWRQPENGMDSNGMLPSMFSVGKIDYNDARTASSLTNTITP